ncbi:hypothetical protein [Roseibium aggregatum]|uniref:Sarcosine oxidase subunit gamma n=1 Tax=Roseibium aggregatum TaxID=187304 RepID=A0A939EFZ6_9HYPH|nr:hypothetical protein [Roseibium aggregatum]MBN9672021.1 hypothetical protein [Roseibium aggregatum]
MTQDIASTVSPASIDQAMRSSPLAERLPQTDTIASADRNCVLDCTRSERFGLRGPGTMSWIASREMTAPEKVNAAVILPCGTALLRLGQEEVLFTAPPGGSGERLREIRQAWLESTLETKGYDAYREEGWAWFLVSGPAAPELMARISMTDLRPQGFPVNQVAQTRALHLDVVAVRFDRFGSPSYELFLDVSSAGFALDVLTETAEGLGSGFQFAELPPGA